MSSDTPKLGVKMSPTAAKAFVDGLNKKIIQRWDERVTKGQFMGRFVEGKLPLSAIRLFFKNWGNFTVEINTLIAASYHKHIGFLNATRIYWACSAPRSPMNSSIRSRPGMFWSCSRPRRHWGSAKDQILREPMLPEARAILDFKRGLLWEGTVAEWWFSMLTEEPIGHWAATWFKTLTTKYGFNPQQAIYFSTHEEADLKEHDDGVMGHGSFNRIVMQRILEDGYADTREGYNLEYCATAAVDLYGVMPSAQRSGGGKLKPKQLRVRVVRRRRRACEQRAENLYGLKRHRMSPANHDLRSLDARGGVHQTTAPYPRSSLGQRHGRFS